MSSFKRRVPSTQGNSGTKDSTSAPHASHAPRSTVIAQPLPSGLRPSPFPALVPLFSTGLASLDDVITGHGIPASSLLALCPAQGLTSISTMKRPDEHPMSKSDSLPKPSRNAASTSRATLEALRAAEDVLLDIMGYGASQGLLAEHNVLIIGSEAEKFAHTRMPARAVSRSEASGGHEKNPSEKEEEMKIAFRYAHRPKFKTTVDEPQMTANDSDAIPSEHRFRAPFDKNHNVSASEIASSQHSHTHRLQCIETTRYDEAWRAIETEVQRLSNHAQPVLRIQLLSLGSSAWSRSSESQDHRLSCLSRFLVRLRLYLRQLALEKSPPVYVLCTMTISPDLLAPPWTDIVTQHTLRLVDAHLLLSDFSHDAHLAKAYAGYGGSVCLTKGPAIGTVLAPGEKRSTLRGGGGEAGSENDVGWRRKKRGLVLETLHEDMDAGASSSEPTPKKESGQDIEEAALGLRRKKPDTHLQGHGHSHNRSPTHGHDSPQNHSHPHDHPEQAAASPPPTARGKPRFEGLKTLRERGMRATKQVHVQVEEDASRGDR